MSSSRIRYLLLAATLVLSLGLRLHAIDEFLVGDETKWICRSISFHKALARRDLASTYQSEHPGVVTMWLGALAVPLADAGDWIELCEETDGSKLTRVRDHDVLSRLPLLIYRARRLVAVATWLGIIAIYVLLRRLVTAWSAVCATMLVALDPFYLALSRVLHLDALLATFMALSMLSLLVYRRDSSSKRYLVVSAISGGLAIANKSPGLFLLPWLALVLGTDVLRSERARRRQCAIKALADLTHETASTFLGAFRGLGSLLSPVGQGLANAALTARLGLLTQRACRPLPLPAEAQRNILNVLRRSVMEEVRRRLKRRTSEDGDGGE